MSRIYFSAFCLLISIFKIYSQDTFSIVAVDSVTGEVGSAGASCIGGSVIISDVHPGVGAIHTQAYYISPNQNYARGLMDQGLPPQQIIDSVVANDWQNNPSIRQYGVVDFTGAAAYTGSNCNDYKNHITGGFYAIQGNILLGQQILDSMESRFLNTPGELACRLMAALQGAKVVGADTRCLDYGISSLSSFLRVAKPEDTTGTLYLDLNVPSIPDYYTVDPIDSLQTLFNAWGACPNVGVQEVSLLPLFQITPDPASGFVILSSEKAMIRVEFFSISGIKMKDEKLSGEKKKEINLFRIPRGMAVLEVTFSNGMREKQLIVLQ